MIVRGDTVVIADPDHRYYGRAGEAVKVRAKQTVVRLTKDIGTKDVTVATVMLDKQEVA